MAPVAVRAAAAVPLLLALLSLSALAASDEQLSLSSRAQVLQVNLPPCAASITDGTKICSCPLSDLTACVGKRDPVVTPAALSSAATLVSNILGRGLSLEPGSAKFAVNSVGAAYIDFSNSCSMLGNHLGLTGGVVLSTGDARAAAQLQNNPSSDTTATSQRVKSSDPDIPGSQDCTTVTFAVTANESTNIVMSYVFQSEEYSEFVDLGFNDQFVFMINKRTANASDMNRANLALVEHTVPVSVNSINYKRLPGYFESCTPYTMFDGNTKLLKSQPYPVEAGQTYDIKMALCDVGDTAYDSTVVIQQSSLGRCESGVAQLLCPSPQLKVCPGTTVPRAAAQNDCGQMDVVRADDNGDELGPGTYEIVFATADFTMTCFYELTIEDVAPQVLDVELRVDGKLYTGGALPANATVSLAFVTQEDCCLNGNNGTILWGDGSQEAFSFGVSNNVFLFTHVYATDGVFAISVAVADCHGTSAVQLVPTTCWNSGNGGDRGDIKQFDVSPNTPVVNTSVLFTYRTQTNSVCRATVSIDFGDGSPLYESSRMIDTSGVEHVYTACGTYVPVLTLIIPDGNFMVSQQGSALTVVCPTPTPPSAPIPSPTPSGLPYCDPSDELQDVSFVNASDSDGDDNSSDDE